MNTEKTVIEAAISYVMELFQNNYGGHDAAHAVRVYNNAMFISEYEGKCDKEIVALAALLHDADDHKLFCTEKNENTRIFLQRHGIEQERIDRICDAINSVSFSQNQGKHPESLEGKIVQDADRLDAIGAIGIARTFAYGGERRRPMDDSIRHFHEKLLLLKAELNTETAKQVAVKRHQFMLSFLKELSEEIGADCKV